MASVNMVILVGNLGANPEVRAFANGDVVCNLRIATTETSKDKAIVRLNDKTVTLNADGQKWHVAYALLHRVLNSSKAQMINAELIKR